MWVGSARPESSARVLDYWLLPRYGPYLLASSEKRPLLKIGLETWDPAPFLGAPFCSHVLSPSRDFTLRALVLTRSLVGFPSKK